MHQLPDGMVEVLLFDRIGLEVFLNVTASKLSDAQSWFKQGCERLEQHIAHSAVSHLLPEQLL